MSEARHSSGQRTSKCEKFSDLYYQENKNKIKRDSFLFFSILILKTTQITYNQNFQLTLPSSSTQ
jgi:hypothetical protein